MKKRQVISIIVALLVLGFAASAQAGEIGKDWKIGVGCEGMYAGPLLQGLSARAWTGPLGMEADVFQGNAKLKVNTSGETETIKGDMWAFELKGMYAFIQKKNSNFYAGANVNYATINADASGDLEGGGNGHLWTYGPFVGTEFNWEEIPELGVNFEFGYMLNNGKVEVDDSDVDARLDMYGINVSLGIHYYF